MNNHEIAMDLMMNEVFIEILVGHRVQVEVVLDLTKAIKSGQTIYDVAIVDSSKSGNVINNAGAQVN